MPKQKFSLPKIDYLNGELWPYISEEQLRIHYGKHHQGYVNNANDLMSKIKKNRQKKGANNIALNNNFVFNHSGHVLHTLFWENLKPKTSKKFPKEFQALVTKEFGNLTNFKQEFIASTKSIQGSGWGALSYNQETNTLAILQIEKHNLNLIPEQKLLLVIDVWEHAYYLDYQNNRGNYLDSIWQIIDWKTVNNRLIEAKK